MKIYPTCSKFATYKFLKIDCLAVMMDELNLYTS